MDIKVFLVPTKNFVKTNPIVICFKNSRAWSDSIWNFVYGCKKISIFCESLKKNLRILKIQCHFLT